MNVLHSFWFRVLLIVSLDLVVIGLGSFAYVARFELPRVPDNLDRLNTQSGVNIYASDGSYLYSLNRSRTFVPLNRMSTDFVNAVLATEDADFYAHRGISVKGILGAIVENLRSGRRGRGGSTITQQIVKNVFLTRERSYTRKFKEWLLAIQLEAMFEQEYGDGYKDKLLELYINGSFYGTNAYGIEDASQVYFGRSASDLTTLQSAILAGLPNAPSAYRPAYGDTAAIAIARRRAAHVLNRMVATGFIDTGQRNVALSDSLRLNPGKRIQNRSPYWVETIKVAIGRKWSASALSFGALDIHTTLDLEMQNQAQAAIDRGVVDLDQRLGFKPYRNADQVARRKYVQVALLCVDYRTGHVKAMVGGRDIFTSYYNRATTAKRQPGSGFKPIVYLSAFESGQITPLTTFVDSPYTYVVNGKDWSPQNFQDSYLGQTTAGWALVKSANATTVQVVNQIGAERVVATARKLGVTGPLIPVPSIALGSNEVTMIDLVTAYATIANTGIRVRPTFITKIVDRNTGNTLYEYQPQPTPVADPQQSYITTRLMQNVVDRGTGYALRRLGVTGPVAGKTGTTNDNTDAWFTGFTPEYVTSVWIGFDSRTGGHRLIEPATRRQITGGSGAAPIWADFVKQLAPSSRRFFVPASVKEHLVDAKTGNLAAHTPESITVALPSDITVPSVDTLRQTEDN